ncbi:MAG: hypothetical protein AB4911_03440 [Oscillochloridaceae bacterium umkhey_bin13]
MHIPVPTRSNDAASVPPYQVPQAVQIWLHQVQQNPGCYQIIGEVGMGKSALLDHIARYFESQGDLVIQFPLRRGGFDSLTLLTAYVIKELLHHNIVIPIDQIAGTTRLQALLEALDRHPTLPATQPVASQSLDQHPRRQLLILVDDLHELSLMDHDELAALKLDAPYQQVRFIFTSQFSLTPPRNAQQHTLSLVPFNLDDVQGLLSQLLLTPVEALAGGVLGRSRGRSHLTYALCCELLCYPDPLAALATMPPFETLDQLAEYRLRVIETDLEHALQLQPELRTRLDPLFGKVLGILAVAPTPIPFANLHQILGCSQADLNILYRILTADIVTDDQSFQIKNPILRDYLRAMPQRHGRYTSEVTYAELQLPIWYRQQFLTTRDLQHLSANLLAQLPRYSVGSEHLDECKLAEVFSREDWKLALEEQASLANVRQAVREAMNAAAQANLPGIRVVGVTLCALMLSSLVTPLLPEQVLFLVAQRIWSRDYARSYSRNYPDHANRQWLLQQLAVTDYSYQDLPSTDTKDSTKFKEEIKGLLALPSHEHKFYLREILKPQEKNKLMAYPSQSEIPENSLNNNLGDQVYQQNLDGIPRNAFITKIHQHAILSLKHFSPEPDIRFMQFGIDENNSLDELVHIWLQWAKQSENTKNWERFQSFSAGRYVDLMRIYSNDSQKVCYTVIEQLMPVIKKIFGDACYQKLVHDVSQILKVYSRS